LSRLLDRLRKIQLQNSQMRVSTNIIAAILIIVSIFIFGGGVYNIISARLGNLVTILPTPSYPHFYYTGMTDQTFNESAYFILFLIMGISGGYLSYRSGRFAFRPREARMFLLIGIALMAVAMIGSEVMLSWKGL
jgi:cation transport ATPase